MRLAEFLLDRADDFVLGHRASEAAERAFDFAQVPELFAELHIADRYNDIAICNICQEARAKVAFR